MSSKSMSDLERVTLSFLVAIGSSIAAAVITSYPSVLALGFTGEASIASQLASLVMDEYVSGAFVMIPLLFVVKRMGGERPVLLASLLGGVAALGWTIVAAIAVSLARTYDQAAMLFAVKAAAFLSFLSVTTWVCGLVSYFPKKRVSDSDHPSP